MATKRQGKTKGNICSKIMLERARGISDLSSRGKLESVIPATSTCAPSRLHLRRVQTPALVRGHVLLGLATDFASAAVVVNSHRVDSLSESKPEIRRGRKKRLSLGEILRKTQFSNNYPCVAPKTNGTQTQQPDEEPLSCFQNVTYSQICTISSGLQPSRCHNELVVLILLILENRDYEIMLTSTKRRSKMSIVFRTQHQTYFFEFHPINPRLIFYCTYIDRRSPSDVLTMLSPRAVIRLGAGLLHPQLPNGQHAEEGFTLPKILELTIKRQILKLPTKNR